MTTTNDIVARLWNLCHTLRDDGVTYHQYVTELTYLLFLKMAQETDAQRQLLFPISDNYFSLPFCCWGQAQRAPC